MQVSVQRFVLLSVLFAMAVWIAGGVEVRMNKKEHLGNCQGASS
jgi:hypothetical protein